MADALNRMGSGAFRKRAKRLPDRDLPGAVAAYDRVLAISTDIRCVKPRERWGATGRYWCQWREPVPDGPTIAGWRARLAAKPAKPAKRKPAKRKPTAAPPVAPQPAASGAVVDRKALADLRAEAAHRFGSRDGTTAQVYKLAAEALRRLDLLADGERLPDSMAERSALIAALAD